MGCWNKTCAISQLPIYAGDRSVTFVIVESPRWDRQLRTNPCYSNGFWDYIPVPLYGKYNDYGAQEDDKGQKRKYIALTKYFKDKLVRIRPQLEGKSQFERYASLKDGNPFLNDETLGQSCHGGVFGIESRENHKDIQPYRHISAMMFRRDIFDALTASVEWETYDKGKSKTHRLTKAELIAVVDEFQVIMKAHEKERKAKIKTLKLGAGDKLTDEDFDFLVSVGSDDHIDKFIAKKYGKANDYDNAVRGMLHFIFGQARGSEAGDAQLVLKSVAPALTSEELVDAYMVARIFYNLRKNYGPMGHEGSQAGITEYHRALVAAMADVIQKVDLEFAEYEDEE